MRAALLLAASAALLPAIARAQDNPACARFEEPLAYNACLASHGPKAKEIGAAPGDGARQIGQDGGASADPPRRAQIAAPAARGMAHVSRRPGRIHMEFRVR
jgi:hypothetical protein